MANATKRTAVAKARGKTSQDVSFSPASAATKAPVSSSAEYLSMAHSSKGLMDNLRVAIFNIWCVIGGPIWNSYEMSIVALFIVVALVLGLSGAMKQVSKLVALLN